ncbi:GntR family transcriptional regulator [Pseudoruegeria sp. SK021]|uniref:GntR family transcriptional regulator n=1 Tax=Pseudoruegeria sp. SK021 TaxID=1933035 RepID=UPI000A2421C5|nr:GntR family transcriptional regulator [Pseudoruegeria sp. SK021]OSP54874.1 GntR family transcriptional regulator [Pseudoruegeria sp. SK021]
MPVNDLHDAAALPQTTSVTSATQGAYNAIRRMILVGDLRPGEKLKIDVLKARLDTGASPVREALSLLTSDQLVERIDQRGFRAAPACQRNFDEILKLRCALEDMALRQSIANADDAWEEHAVLSLHRMSREDSKTSDTYEDLHKGFHMALLANCGSPILLKFCSQLYDLNVRYRYLAGRSLDYKSRHVGDEHAEILAAAVKRDVGLASDRLLSHYQKTGAFLRQSGLVSES